MKEKKIQEKNGRKRSEEPCSRNENSREDKTEKEGPKKTNTEDHANQKRAEEKNRREEKLERRFENEKHADYGSIFPFNMILICECVEDLRKQKKC